MSQGRGEVELDDKETVGGTRKSDAPHSADSAEETCPPECPPECPPPSAADEDTSESVQNDNRLITTGDFFRNTNEEAAATREDATYISTSFIPTAKQDASVSTQVQKIPEVFKAEIQQESQQFTSSPEIQINRTRNTQSLQRPVDRRESLNHRFSKTLPRPRTQTCHHTVTRPWQHSTVTSFLLPQK